MTMPGRPAAARVVTSTRSTGIPLSARICFDASEPRPRRSGRAPDAISAAKSSRVPSSGRAAVLDSWRATSSFCSHHPEASPEPNSASAVNKLASTFLRVPQPAYQGRVDASDGVGGCTCGSEVADPSCGGLPGFDDQKGKVVTPVMANEWRTWIFGY